MASSLAAFLHSVGFEISAKAHVQGLAVCTVLVQPPLRVLFHAHTSNGPTAHAGGIGLSASCFWEAHAAVFAV